MTNISKIARLLLELGLYDATEFGSEHIQAGELATTYLVNSGEAAGVDLSESDDVNALIGPMMAEVELDLRAEAAERTIQRELESY